MACLIIYLGNSQVNFSNDSEMQKEAINGVSPMMAVVSLVMAVVLLDKMPAFLQVC